MRCSNTVLSTLPAVAAALAPRAAADGSCADVHLVLGRGNNEPYPGRQGKLVDAVCGRLRAAGSTCDYEDIHFDNAYEVEFCSAVTAGVEAGKQQLAAYASRCPDSRIVLSGYSQGASVVGDLMAGGGGTFFQGCVQPESEGLDRGSVPGKNIAAALLFGDTRHTGGQSYNALSGAAADGIFPRPGAQLAAMNAYADVLRSFCVETDPICAKASGAEEVVETHLNYFEIYPAQAAEWVQSVLAKGGLGSSSSSSRASSTSAAQTTSTATSEAASSSSSKDVVVTTTSKKSAAISTAGPSTSVKVTSGAANSTEASTSASATLPTSTSSSGTSEPKTSVVSESKGDSSATDAPTQSQAAPTMGTPASTSATTAPNSGAGALKVQLVLIGLAGTMAISSLL